MEKSISEINYKEYDLKCDLDGRIAKLFSEIKTPIGFDYISNSSFILTANKLSERVAIKYEELKALENNLVQVFNAMFLDWVEIIIYLKEKGERSIPFDISSALNDVIFSSILNKPISFGDLLKYSEFKSEMVLENMFRFKDYIHFKNEKIWQIIDKFYLIALKIKDPILKENCEINKVKLKMVELIKNPFSRGLYESVNKTKYTLRDREDIKQLFLEKIST